MAKIDIIVSGGTSDRSEVMEFAQSSWEALADRIIIDYTDCVPIKTLLQKAVESCPDGGVILLVNRDIQLTPAILRLKRVAMENGLDDRWAATSFRHQTDGGRWLGVIDQGLDAFAMTKPVAMCAEREIHPGFTIGRCLWDNWMNQHLASRLMRSHYFDFTHWECVIHPKHESGARRNSYPGSLGDELAQLLTTLPCVGIPQAKYG